MGEAANARDAGDRSEADARGSDGELGVGERGGSTLELSSGAEGIGFGGLGEGGLAIAATAAGPAGFGAVAGAAPGFFERSGNLESQIDDLPRFQFQQRRCEFNICLAARELNEFV